jgi:outer membrane protein TolC
VLDLAPPPPLVADGPPTLGDALAAAEENRPDVLSAKAAVHASGSALKQAEIRSRPVADISGRYEWGYTDWTRRDPSWDVALALSWTLFDGYATQADITSARASLARSEAQLQGMLDQVGLDVASALAEIERARERVTATAKSVAAAEARLEAAQGKYQQGVGILLEVTDARDDLTGAQANQVEADHDYRTALVGLQRVMGTLSAPEAEGGVEQAR